MTWPTTTAMLQSADTVHVAAIHLQDIHGCAHRLGIAMYAYERAPYAI